jgi:KipI family sensor histidine kinase inhibitor
MSYEPKFLSAGDRALVVELGNTVDEATNALVVALDSALAAQEIAGIVEMVPTYRSLLVMFDPALISRSELRQRILACWPPDAARTSRYRRWTIPVLYGGEAGEDLDFVAKSHGLSPDEVIRLHASAEYRVYMIGFAPGFAYLGGLPERLHTSRRVDPRMRIPASSISIGGKQAAVCPPIEIPSGWQLLGRTPVKTYDPARREPFLLAAGDRVVFRPISADEFNALSAAADSGDPVAAVEMIDG